MARAGLDTGVIVPQAGEQAGGCRGCAGCSAALVPLPGVEGGNDSSGTVKRRRCRNYVGEGGLLFG